MMPWPHEWLWVPIVPHGDGVTTREMHAFEHVEFDVSAIAGYGSPLVKGIALCDRVFDKGFTKRNLVLTTTGDVNLAPHDACPGCVAATKVLNKAVSPSA